MLPEGLIIRRHTQELDEFKFWVLVPYVEKRDKSEENPRFAHTYEHPTILYIETWDGKITRRYRNGVGVSFRRIDHLVTYLLNLNKPMAEYEWK